MKKLLTALGAILLFFGTVLGGGYYYFLVRPLPVTKGQLHTKGLISPIKIYRDNWGVPHIYASNEHDLFFAQGFVQAQDRLWQMDLNRRTAAGRLSEIFGEIAVDADKVLRTFKLYHSARIEYELSELKEKEILLAFAEGVNAFIKLTGSKLPVEFRLLGYTPEPWKPEDSLAWSKMMALSGGKNWQEELVRALLQKRLGRARSSALFSLMGESEFCILSALRSLPLLPMGNRFAPIWAGLGGSNNWVISPAKSSTGAPLLANDMHLPLTIPSAWYEMHLNGGNYNVEGLSLSGIPLIIAGHNDHVAWGITFAYVDSQDLYLEKSDPMKSDRFLYNGKYFKAKEVSEKIYVKGRKNPISFKFLETKHGPIITECFRSGKSFPSPMALRWSAHEPSQTTKSLRLMNQAHNARDFVRAAHLWGEPSINLVFADTGGHIGYVLGGRVPLRHNRKGLLPVQGWVPENDWAGWLESSKKPLVFDPPQGFIVTANNRITPVDFPYYIGGDFAPGYRAARIKNLLSSRKKISLQDCKEIQADLMSLPARELIKILQNVTVSDPDALQLVSILKHWNAKMEAESTGAAVYGVLIYKLMENIFGDELGELSDTFFGKGLNFLNPLSRFCGHSRVALQNVIRDPDSLWWDNIKTKDKVETFQDIIQTSLKQAFILLSEKFGPHPENWNWGGLHTVTIMHPLGRVKYLSKIFNLGPFPGSGHFSTVLQSAVVPGNDFSLKGWSVSNRHIYDIGNWDRSVGSIVPGQSGHRASGHYADQLGLWKRVEHHPLPFSKESVMDSAKEVLELLP